VLAAYIINYVLTRTAIKQSAQRTSYLPTPNNQSAELIHQSTLVAGLYTVITQLSRRYAAPLWSGTSPEYHRDITGTSPEYLCFLAAVTQLSGTEKTVHPVSFATHTILP